ncbi:PH domain-containing protein [Candidatus Uhrbacteria bacterium]|nr:PH domain-containing protein [Candidatus Uhrbacteria bacterium]
MLGLHETLSLDTHENILGTYRCNVFKTALRILPCVLFLCMLFLFIFPFFYRGTFGVLTFLVLLFLDALCIARFLVQWYGTFYILTERRLFSVRRYGFFKKKVHEILLENINELSYDSKGIIQTLLQYGTIHCKLFPANTHFEIVEVSRPQEVLTSISRRAALVRKSAGVGHRLDQQAALSIPLQEIDSDQPH